MKLPLLSAAPDRPVLWSQGRAVSARELMHWVKAMAATPQTGHYSVNLCERRDTFIVSFCAALVRGHTNLLPSSRAQSIVDEAVAMNPGSYRCDDSFVEASCGTDIAEGAAAFELAGDHVAVKAYTSGSTGVPQAHVKLWRSFAHSTRLNAQIVRATLAKSGISQHPWIVATVPPQHMYGLETSVLLPLLGDMAVHAGRPLFPADIAAALAEVPEPRVLVTTPVHLRAIAASSQSFPRVALVLSATAPLDTELARQIEARLDTRLLEMFGATETCVIATRRTARELSWRLYPDVLLKPDSDGVNVAAPWFAAPMRLQDIVELQDGAKFVVRGRNADMVEVAGKRASLADLTRRLLAIPGVRDAVVFQPDSVAGGKVRRVAALVVADDLSLETIGEQLARSVDAAFIPRPLLRVKELPRNEVGKLPRERLLAALREHAGD